jgi:hypothetical protein
MPTELEQRIIDNTINTKNFYINNDGFYVFTLSNGRSFNIPIDGIAERRAFQITGKDLDAFLKEVARIRESYKNDPFNIYRDIIKLKWDDIKDIAVENPQKQINVADEWEIAKKTINDRLPKYIL